MVGTKGIKDYSKIYYDHQAKFKIIPAVSQELSEQLSEFISELHNSHKVENNRHSFFWTFDPKFNTIIIDESTDMVENNIFEQFNLIASWLFERGYNLVGYFICRTNKKVECIFSNGHMKSISHYIIFDDRNSENVSAIIEDAKKMMLRVIELDHNLGAGDKKDELLESIKNIQQRIEMLESAPKNYFLKFTSVLVTFSIGFLYAYLLYNYPNYTFEQCIASHLW